MRRYDSMIEKLPGARYSELIDAFAAYFAGQGGPLSIRKGILLSGCTGCGKTTLFKLFNFVAVWDCDNPRRPLSGDNAQLFEWHSCRGIAMEYADKQRGGVESLKKYFSGDMLFDDFGAENISSHFGSKADVMGEIIQSRYERKGKTFITTNLNYEQIQKNYGERVASRLAEMCSWVDVGIDEDYRR
ncbi:MAG: hypothetical protein K2O66_03800 [Bacteroidales bacterium]|nr:hypothetical protein [Bacteroidales bacterium]